MLIQIVSYEGRVLPTEHESLAADLAEKVRLVVGDFFNTQVGILLRFWGVVNFGSHRPVVGESVLRALGFLLELRQDVGFDAPWTRMALLMIYLVLVNDLPVVAVERKVRAVGLPGETALALQVGDSPVALTEEHIEVPGQEVDLLFRHHPHSMEHRGGRYPKFAALGILVDEVLEAPTELDVHAEPANPLMRAFASLYLPMEGLFIQTVAWKQSLDLEFQGRFVLVGIPHTDTAQLKESGTGSLTSDYIALLALIDMDPLLLERPLTFWPAHCHPLLHIDTLQAHDYLCQFQGVQRKEICYRKNNGLEADQK